MSGNWLLEPAAPSLYNDILPLFCTARLRAALDNAYAAELAARVFAMRNATNNAEELIETLTLKCNKLRQANITRELIEITAGAEVFM